MAKINLGKVVGEDGRGIVSIEKTSTVGLVDTYTITYTDGTTSTYNVTNGSGGGGIDSVIHNETMVGAGTNASPLGVDTTRIALKSEIPDISGKQDTLVNGENIKTINNQSILGSGNLDIGGGSGTSDYDQLNNRPSINNNTLTGNKTSSQLGLQSELVSGTNIKTINNQSLLGSGNIDVSGGGSLDSNIKNAILDCFEHTAWVNEQGQYYYGILQELFFPSKVLTSIEATFVQGETKIYDSTNLNDLKEYLTVTAYYDDGSQETINNYELNGTLIVGISVITVNYIDKTDTFNVLVTETPELSNISAIYTQIDEVFPSDSLDSLKSDLVVKAIYSDSSQIILNENEYNLSGNLEIGTSTITVSYNGKTTTFDVTVTQTVELSYINVVYNQSGVVHTSDSLDSLKSDLVVTAVYSDSSSRVVNDYVLSGTLISGTSTITVSYNGKTTTFDVTVEGLIPNDYQQVEWIEANVGPVIDTMRIIDDLNYEIRTGMQCIGTPTGTKVMFGRTAPSVLANQDSGYVLANYAKRTSATGGTGSTLIDKIHDIVLNKNSIKIDNNYEYFITGEDMEFTTDRHMLIFAWPEDDNNTPYRQGHFRCSYFQIYHNGVLVNNLIPCYKKSNNVIGMYDTIQNAFRTNIGTGDFSKGSDV